MKKYEVTSIDTGRTIVLSQKEAYEKFGKIEFKEILMGYLPNIVAIEIKS